MGLDSASRQWPVHPERCRRRDKKCCLVLIAATSTSNCCHPNDDKTHDIQNFTGHNPPLRSPRTVQLPTNPFLSLAPDKQSPTMAGGHMKYRQLSRDSAHRQALLRNLVTSLIKEESIQTTWPKAKEAQRLAEKLISFAKQNDEVARRKAQSILYVGLPATFLFATATQLYLHQHIHLGPD